MIQLIVFLLVSIVLLSISWKSLHDPRSHGFYRFFAWECIVGLVLLNASVWFRDPLSSHQIISWILLIFSIFPLVLGIRMLRTVGQPDQNKRVEANLLGFEKTTTLVTNGIYKYIRHPLYTSLLLLNWGTFFKNANLLNSLLAVVCTIFLIATAKADEKECTQVFGLDYQAYMKHSKMFVPFIF